MKVEFTVPGIPVAKQRPKFSRQGAFVRSYTPDKTVNYESLVKISYTEKNGETKLSGALRAEIRAFFPIPKSVSKKKHEQMASGKIRHDKKPDADNCAKSILDALNKIAFDDDGQIAELYVYKYYSEVPKAVVILEEI